MITIIDFGMGNLGSIQNIIKKIGYSSRITSDVSEIESAEKLILPGVGSYDKAIKNLEASNLIEAIKSKAISGTPLLGICLGMQLLGNSSEEGVLTGLGLIPGTVKKFNIDPPLKVPHMGWNVLNYNQDCLLYSEFDNFEETRFYFVHSYYFECDDPTTIAATTNYCSPFTSSIYKNNIYGTQFHPEKSHKFGMKLLRNFIEKINATN